MAYCRICHVQWILVILLTLATDTPGISGDMEEVLERCCKVGSAWGDNSTSCTGPPLPLAGIQAADRSICQTAIYICCIRIHKDIYCHRGRESAMAGHLCTTLLIPGGETHKDCCDGCSLGLKAAGRKQLCTLRESASFGTPWDESYAHCCLLDQPDQPLLPQLGGDNCRLGKTICQHLCKMVNGTEKCYCLTGYRLRSDQTSCEDLDECLLGTHSCTASTEYCQNYEGGFHCFAKGHPTGDIKNTQCRVGLAWNHQKQTCDDVDECARHVCPPEQTCRNTIGSYTCKHDDCPAGFKKHIVTSKCIDIDECAEGIDDCDHILEQCLNSHGHYQCEMKSNKPRDCLAGFKWSNEKSRCEDVNECIERKHTCSEETQECLNSIGSYQCQPKQQACPSGYRQKLDLCDDIDECEESIHNCNINQECLNAVGSFRCYNKVPLPGCGIGYQNTNGFCVDINECEEGIDTCDKGIEICHNSEGSFICVPVSVTSTHVPDTVSSTVANRATKKFIRTRRPKFRVTPTRQVCTPGYKYSQSSHSCVDIDECTDANPCSTEQTCENTDGSYRCFCQQGYTMDAISKTCIDVNECQLSLHSCSFSHRCDNTIGSFTCVRIAGCGTGYTLNAHNDMCEDDDECALSIHDCGTDYACRNTEGSFRCDRVRCPTGQRLLPDRTCQVVTCNPGMETDAYGNCIDIDECSGEHTCRTNQKCVNTIGSYRCQNLMDCANGYELNEFGTQCLDIDECAQRIHECSPQQMCRNLPGSYKCECPPGFTLNHERQCEDIDECIRYRGQVCSITSTCVNTVGSYTCNCKAGFKKSEDGRNCIDVDECNESPDICQQTCINVWGSHQCSCQQGYTLASDGRTCQDIDECTMWEGRGNLCIGICVNEPGSYSCTCPEGYRLGPDKRTCQDIDECEEQTICKGENEVCLNTRGSFRCNIIHCPHNYVRDREHRNRCKRIDCRQGDEVCRQEPVSYSYNYITFVSNMKIPLTGQIDLFTMRGPRFTHSSVQFELALKEVTAPEGVTPATESHFNLRRISFNEAMVSLIKPIPGPQELELELILKMYHSGLFNGIAVAKLFIFVSPNEY